MVSRWIICLTCVGLVSSCATKGYIDSLCRNSCSWHSEVDHIADCGHGVLTRLMRWWWKICLYECTYGHSQLIYMYRCNSGLLLRLSRWKKWNCRLCSKMCCELWSNLGDVRLYICDSLMG